jgi:hypothetical protein
MADPFENFVLPLRAVFSDPKTSLAVETGGDTTQFYATVAVAVADFSAEALKEAANRLIRAPRDQFDGRAFPAIDRCVEACQQAEGDIKARKRAAAQPAKRAAGADDWRFTDEQLTTPLARQAAKEGWAAIFLEFCREHGRHPTPCEITKARLARREWAEKLKATEDGGNMSRIARAILNALKRREENSRKKILEAK